VTDATNNDVTIYAPQSMAGAPLVTSESAVPSGDSAAMLGAGVVPVGNDATCQFEYVDYANFNATGYSAATTIPCVPPDLGSGFRYQAATATILGLASGTVYHFRVVASSSAGTTTGVDQEFQAGPGAWASFPRCPVDDPAMLATQGYDASTGTGTMGFCLSSNSTHGSISIGNLTTTTGNTDLQIGLVSQDALGGPFKVIAPSNGSLVADPVQLTTPVGSVTAVTESAGRPSNFCLFCGIEADQPIITIPIKIHLQNSVLGRNCFIGSNKDPILLNPENTDLSNARSVGAFFSFHSNGTPDAAGPDGALLVTGLVQSDDTFAVPGATGCGAHGSLNGLVDSVAGVPSPSGDNHLLLDDGSSGLALPENGEGGQAFANDWHVAFGG
jgi:hypothetical protein